MFLNLLKSCNAFVLAGKQEGFVCGLIDVHDLVKPIVYSLLSFSSFPSEVLQSRNARLLRVLSFCLPRCVQLPFSRTCTWKNVRLHILSFMFLKMFKGCNVSVGRSNKEGLDSGLIDVHKPVKAIASSFFLFKILNFLDFDAHKKQFPVPYVHHLRAFAGQNWETVKSTVFLSSRM